MTITKARRKIKIIKHIISEYSLMENLIKAINIAKTKGLAYDPTILQNVTKRRDDCLKKLDALLK
ncbi:MAG: hypothetical protein WC554_01855 [Clostridia bacterium]